QMPELLEALQTLYPRVADLGAVQDNLFQVGQTGQPLNSLVGDLRAAQFQDSELGQPADSGHASVADGGVVQAEKTDLFDLQEQHEVSVRYLAPVQVHDASIRDFASQGLDALDSAGFVGRDGPKCSHNNQHAYRISNRRSHHALPYASFD